ncbi:MAG: sodium-independent anion transporter [Omnitrophica WOR_2 bacterium GWF2_43_52]|nr:MAG: sodium-independent anion transporter [Omnitrophica WOR_2 bacterium GWF2_43_52]HAH20595.1 sodium-independent anion transporter [Candidatus Omnitrophota bacterium]HBG63514.1 sodium-independent anion transporter [Candidatus Omnitrophota bacterium]HCD39195.1 sodium-independent anion transporter [Candidatus Omnitrophota bacterium]
MLYPKLFTTLKGYTKEQFLSDSIAGIIVGIVAIPLAIAFAIASGLSPEKGLFTAIIGGFLISALGGSRVQIGGPTGAFVIIVYAMVQKYGVDALVVATLMAGCILVVMGFAGFGTIIKFIPYSVVVGFTSGIAVVIFSSQVKDFFGLAIDKVPAEFIEKLRVFFEFFGTVNLYALALALVTVLLIAIWPRRLRKVPGSLFALLLTSLLVKLFHLPVETIGSRFGELPHTLPLPKFHPMDIKTIQHLFQPAFTIAVLGAIESLLSCVVSDGMIGGKHRSNMELIGQGAANIGSAIFGGMPATGAIARTVTNIKNGGRTPVAGMMHAVTILIIMLFLGRWIKLVPLACLAGILVVVAYHMSEWRSFRDLLKGPRGDVVVLLATFLVTIFIDLTAAIQLGAVLSAFIFMKRMSDVPHIKVIAKEIEEDAREIDLPINYKAAIPKGVEIYEINGPLFFGVANQLDETDRIIGEKPLVRILRFRDVPLIDSTGLRALTNFYHKCKKSGIQLIITGLHIQPLNEMVKSNLYDLIGEDNVFSNMNDALTRAREFLAKK